MRLLPIRRKAQPDHLLGPVTAIGRMDDGFEALHEGGRRRVRFLENGVAEIRLTPRDVFSPEASRARDPGASWGGPSGLVLRRHEDAVVASTDALTVRAASEGGLSVSDVRGVTLLESVGPPSWRPGDRGDPGRLHLTLALRRDERILGLGDRAVGLDRRRHRFELWNTDARGFERGSDPLYKSIPFLLSVRSDGTTVGLFVDSYARSTVDVGRKKRTQLRLDIGESEVACYILHASSPIGVIQLFARLTGLPPLPPRWALGYHQSRHSYESEDEMRRVAFELRRRRIPCDALYFDIHYMDGFRMFTWDRRAFPNPDLLIHDLHDDGFKTVAIADPGISVKPPDDPVLRDGLERDVFLRHADGRPFEGNVWPGPCHFPDFLRPDVRAWWAGHLGSLLQTGIDGIWCDMNEPSVFVEETSGRKADRTARTIADDVVHAVDGIELPHARVHNVYGQEMQRASFDALRAHRPDRRAFTITRAAYAGAQRFGATWTGDNSATWEHLRLGLEQCLSLSVSGMPFCGTDVGGYAGHPSSELMVRWMQAGVLTPFFRNHSSIDSPRREPWRFEPRFEAACRAAIELRYRLLPYLYTAMHGAATRGTPVLRPLDVMHPADEVIAAKRPFGMYLGDAVLAFPVVAPRTRRLRVYLPDVPGGWYDFHTGEHLAPGFRKAAAPLDRLPLFVRAGAILPLGPLVQTTGDLGSQPLTLRVFPGRSAFTSLLYEDAGEGMDFEDGSYLRVAFRVTDAGGTLQITPDSSGAYQPAWEAWHYEVFGLDRAPRASTAEGRDLPARFEDGVLRVTTSPSEAVLIVR